jgi:hypothetical protein
MPGGGGLGKAEGGEPTLNGCQVGSTWILRFAQDDKNENLSSTRVILSAAKNPRIGSLDRVCALSVQMLCKCCQGGRADVVLDALGVDLGCLFGYAE